jgi:hypothetical protein
LESEQAKEKEEAKCRRDVWAMHEGVSLLVEDT